MKIVCYFVRDFQAFEIFAPHGGSNIQSDVMAAKTIAVEEKPIKRLYRSGKDKVLGGVCGGIAEYLNVDPVLIRLIWAVSILAYGTGFLLYIVAWIIIPRNPKHKWED